MKGKKGTVVFVLTVAVFVLVSVFFILGEEGVEEKPKNVGDIIRERIKSEIPVSDIKISNEGEVFEVNAMTKKEKIFLFLEEKIGKTGEKMRFLSPLLPDEIRFRCRVRLVTLKDGESVRPVIDHMSLNEYEIPSSVLENIVDFPLISGGV